MKTKSNKTRLIITLTTGQYDHLYNIMCSQDEIIDFPDIDKSDYSTVSLTKKKGGSYNNEVWFYKVEGGGHDWPGAWGNQDINASEEIWKFFKKHIN